jgi:hypothetical protein
MTTAIRGVLDDLQRLYKNGADPIRTHLSHIAKRDRGGRWRDESLKLDFGQPVELREFVLVPISDHRSFSGPALCEAILERYNEDYWLIALWNQLLERAKDSRVATDLVRAFIRHSIYLTGEEFLTSGGRTVSPSFIRDNGLRNRVDYYRTLFSWNQLVACMRLSERRGIVERLRNDPSAIKGFRLRKLSREQVLGRLPEINRLLVWSDLPTIVRDAEEQVENIQPILRWIYLNWHFWRKSRDLRAELTRVLEFGQPLNYKPL